MSEGRIGHVVIDEERVIIAVHGSLDAELLDPLVRAATAAPGCDQAVLDIAGVEFLDSHGMRTILKARHRLADVHSRPLVITNAHPNVKSVLRVAGLDDYLMEHPPGP